MRYLLIPLTDTALNISAATPQPEDELSDGQRDALAPAFERTVHTCELLVAYPVAVAGKPSTN